MFVLGLQGSPRKNGNTALLLSKFINEMQNLGADTHVIEVAQEKIVPCKECLICESKGICSIDDNISKDFFPWLRKADIILLASPVFFYSVTAQLKAFIDRSQTLWSRKYRLKLKDPKSSYRKGFVLSVGATKGKNLFDGLNLTAKYFFDAVSASFEGFLSYRNIEKIDDLSKNPDVDNDVKSKVEKLLDPFIQKKKILFISNHDACCTQMAKGFLQKIAGASLEIESYGLNPKNKINPFVVDAMAEKGIDMAFIKPTKLGENFNKILIKKIILFDIQKDYPLFSGIKIERWNIENPSDKSKEIVYNLRDIIEREIKNGI